MEPKKPTADEEKQERRVRRRGFLGLAAGLVVGGAAASVYHLLAPPKEVETPTGVRARSIDFSHSKGTIPIDRILTEKTEYAVKITVLHCPDPKDVVPEEMIEEIRLKYIMPCPVFTEGQEIIIEPGEPPRMPWDFCRHAREAIYPSILHLGSGGDFLGYHYKKGVTAAACPSGARPVSFLLERI